MIIDLILDRKDNEQFDGVDTYKAHDFYFSCMRYGSIADKITRAMDEGTEEEVKPPCVNTFQSKAIIPKLKTISILKSGLSRNSTNKNKIE